MLSKKKKSQSLSEKIADIFVPKPLADPENDSDNDTAARIIDFDDDDIEQLDHTISDFRKRNTKILSEYDDKYKGKISSRKEFEESNEELETGSEDLNESEDENSSDQNENLQDNKKNGETTEHTEDSSEEDYENDNEEESDSDYTSGEVSQPETETNILEDTNQESAELQKAFAVQNQLKLWEKLLEVRIHSQKMLIKANSLPQLEEFKKISKIESFSTLAKETKENVLKLLDNLLELQQSLASQYSETKSLLTTTKRKRTKFQSNDHEEPSTKKFAIQLQDDFENFRTYRDSVLQKWYDRTQILTPNPRGNKSSSLNIDVLKKIETVLLNRDDLIKKSQLVKGSYQLFGNIPESPVEQEEGEDKTQNEDVICPEVYDDTDFYHQQLRELIEFKSNISSNPLEMTKQFAELQKLRQKMKKKVDTRASKGRKIRYVVHNKLINFMAPNPNSDWTEESKNELYRSLFGL